MSQDQDQQDGTSQHISGWCNDGHHAGRTYRWGQPCPRDDIDCHCPCHRGESPACPR